MLCRSLYTDIRKVGAFQRTTASACSLSRLLVDCGEEVSRVTESVSTCLLGPIVMASFAECHETGVDGWAHEAQHALPVHVCIYRMAYMSPMAARGRGRTGPVWVCVCSVCDGKGVRIRMCTTRSESTETPLNACP